MAETAGKKTAKSKKQAVLSILAADKDKLIDEIGKAYLSMAYHNRYTLHPRKLREMAKKVVDSFEGYLAKTTKSDYAQSIGTDSAKSGLGQDSFLKAHALLREYFTKAMPEPEISTFALSSFNVFADTSVSAFVETCTSLVMADQEQLRVALSTALESQRQELYVKNYAINTSANGIMLTDMEGKITYINPTFTNMWHIEKPDDTLGTSCARFFALTPLDDVVGLLKRQGSWQGEADSVNGEGSMSQLAISASLIRDESNELAGVMAFFSDITDQKRLEAQFRQAQKMEALGQLAGGIVHDFNNLLTAISGYTQLELMDLPNNSPQYQDFLQIKLATDKGKELTEELRIFTRQASSNLVALNLNRIVDEIYKLLKRTFPPEIKIRLAFDPALHTVKANPSQMSQMIMNLCVNARDAIQSKRQDSPSTNGGGEISLQTSNVVLTAARATLYLNAKPGEYVCISVTDTGRGMDSEVMDRLFEPFFTTKGEKRGTGLGLAVVYGIVQNHGGFIDVHSRGGEGSAFDVYMPVSEDGRREVRKKSFSGNLISGRGTILVVEDEPQVREMIQATLVKAGYKVLLAPNGMDGLNMYRKYGEEIDLVVLDMVMPKMDGHQCFHRLRELDDEVKIIIITGYTTDGSADDFVEEGALTVIEKPFELDSFTAFVQQAIK